MIAIENGVLAFKADCLRECLDCLVVLFLRKKLVPLFLELDRLVFYGAQRFHAKSFSF